jgi:predicted pyridoxine 5'-phosphate oxidase superfamily flavin-nucleotide-binding protein
MAEFTDTLTDKHIAFIEKQPVFFTATAAEGARINLSPKGYADSFRVLSESQVAYLDLGGSGNETHAHLAADGRITIMFCAFDRSALILRIYGRGRAVLPHGTRSPRISPCFPAPARSSSSTSKACRRAAAGACR